MTREEAVQKLITHKLWHQDEFIDFTGTVEAIDMAIEALQEQKAGKWIAKQNDYEYEVLDSWKCSECEYAVYEKKTDYCPNCGASMRGEEE